MATDFKSLIKPMPKDEDNFLAADVFKPLFASPPGKSQQFTMWFSKKNYDSPLAKQSNRTVPAPRNGTSDEWCAYFRLTGMLPETPTHSSPAEEICSDPRWLPTIQAVYAAAARPGSRFSLVAESDDNDPFKASRIRDALLKLHRSLIVYAQAQMEAGRLAEVMPAFYVWDHLSRAKLAEPDSYEHSSPLGVMPDTHALLKSGMRQHRWPAPFLTKLLETNYPLLYRDSSQRAFQMERIRFGSIFEQFPESMDGYFYYTASSFRQLFFKHIVPDYFPMRAAVRTSQHYGKIHAATVPLKENENWPTRIRSLINEPILIFGPQAIFGPLWNDERPAQIFVSYHVVPIVRASLRHLAIALELHYLSHGKYPPSLGALDIALAMDPLVMKDVDGQSIRYSTNATGAHFTLRSVGANGMLDAPGQENDDPVFSTEPTN